jgi:hypothetical protein
MDSFITPETTSSIQVKQVTPIKPKCKALKKNGEPCPHFAKHDEFCGQHKPKTEEDLQRKKENAAKKLAEKMAMPDLYTEEILREEFQTHREYVLKRKQTKEKTGLDIRMPNMPEDISENITKFIIHHHVGDTSSKWTKGIKGKGPKITGDLISEIEKTQEVKCFTSDGPTSFGPKEKWDVIYFLDAREWLNGRFVLWRVVLKNVSDTWKAVKMNKDQTHEYQSEEGRRPRITWESLYPQINAYAENVFDGTFEDIFRLKKEKSSNDEWESAVVITKEG